MNAASFLLVLLSIFNTISVEAVSCPCYSASDLTEPVHEFVNVEDGPIGSGYGTKCQLTLANRFRYMTADAAIPAASFQAYVCSVALLREDFSENQGTEIAFDVINRQEYYACRDLLRDAGPSTKPPTNDPTKNPTQTPTNKPTLEPTNSPTKPPTGEPLSLLQAFDRSIDGVPITLQNVGTGQYLTVASDGSIITEELANRPSLSNQWEFIEEECPALGSSAARDTTRTCFRLASLKDPETILGTNGGGAFLHHPPANILSVYVLEPTTACHHTLASCILQIQVAYYGERAVADITVDGSTTMELAVGADQDLAEAEWIIDYA